MDEYAVYFGATDASKNTVNLWRLPWAEARRANAQLVLSQPLKDSRDWLMSLDADQGHVVLGLFCWSKTQTIVYNDHTKEVTTHYISSQPVATIPPTEFSVIRAKLPS